MITVLAAPLENKVLLDANNSVIRIISSNGTGYYFRALIYIDDVLFDTQGWSRESAFVASKDLKKLYSGYFTSVFSPLATSGLTEQTQLIKKINITINEHSHATGAVVATVDLPTFFIMFNQNPVKFIDTTKAQFLDVVPDVMQVPLDGKISIPFFVNAESEDVACALTDGTVTFHNASLTGVSGKKAYLYTVDFSALSIPTTQEWFRLDVTVGATTISKTFRVFLLPVYEIKKLAFKNNFGFFIYAYMEGDLQIAKAYKGEAYAQADDSEKVFEISEDATYTLNTGSLLSDEKKLIPQLCNSVDVRLFYAGEWFEMVNRSKRYREFADENHTFEEDLVFNLSGNKAIRNYFFETEAGGPPAIGDLPAAEVAQAPDGSGAFTWHAPDIFDPDDDDYTMLWTTEATGVTITNETTEAPSFALLSTAPSNFTVLLTVTDSSGLSASKSFDVIFYNE